MDEICGFHAASLTREIRRFHQHCGFKPFRHSAVSGRWLHARACGLRAVSCGYTRRTERYAALCVFTSDTLTLSTLTRRAHSAPHGGRAAHTTSVRMVRGPTRLDRVCTCTTHVQRSISLLDAHSSVRAPGGAPGVTVADAGGRPAGGSGGGGAKARVRAGQGKARVRVGHGCGACSGDALITPPITAARAPRTSPCAPHGAR